MKSFIAISSLVAAALAIPVAEVKEATTCPRINGAQVESNNLQPYKLSCHKYVDGTVIRITDTEIGYKGCLTACDGTVGCVLTQYIATDTEQKKGSCTVYSSGKILEGTNDSNAWTVAEPLNKPKVSSTTSATPSPTATNPARFFGLSIRSGSEIQYLSVNANGRQFWLNKNTTVYCPRDDLPCGDKSNPQTIFAGGDNTLSLSVNVPGGQQVYVTKEGALGFTQAHSASVPDGAIREGFGFKEGGLQFKGQDWFACPLGKQNGNAFGIYAVAEVKGSNAGANCLGFRFRTVDAASTNSFWQYT